MRILPDGDLRRIAEAADSGWLPDEFWLSLTRFLIGGLQPINPQDPATREVLAAFDRHMPPLPGPLRVYRAMHLRQWTDLKAKSDFRSSKTITLPGWISTSMSFNKTMDWLSEAWMDNGNRGAPEPKAYIMFAIDTAPGARGIAVNAHADRLAQVIEEHEDEFLGMEIFENEEEVVLGRDARFAVRSVDRKSSDINDIDDYWRVWLQQLP